jgi:SAM-dependent methyltransferase
MFSLKLERIASYLGYEKKQLIEKAVPYKTRKYQFDLVNFNIQSGDAVLDIGSGAHPFKYGTVQLDLYHEDNFHRGGTALTRDARPNIVADIENMPFTDNQFDFAYCSHVLEHVPNPAKACTEIMRVAKRGYIETPTRLSDIMSDITYLHTWHVSMIGTSLVFIPYSEREKKGTGVKAFEAQMHSPYQNDFSSMVYGNRDLFCNMMLWEDRFDYFVFDHKGNLVDSSK